MSIGMGPKKGDRPGAEKNFKGKKGGRPKGSPDRISRTAKENIIAVFDGVGGITAMINWAKRNRTEFYKLYARLVPIDVTARVDKRDASELTDRELAEIIASASRAGVAEAEDGEGIAPGLH